MILYSRDWTKVHTTDIRSRSYTLTEFLALIQESVPAGTSDDDICIDFNIDACEEYNDYGEKFIDQKADLQLLVRKKT